MKQFGFLFATILLSISCFAQKESLTIAPGDTLHVKVLESPELDQVARVTDAGTLPLIVGGNVKVAGLIPSEAASIIRLALVDSNYLLAPHVSVTIEQSATQNVTVSGQVRSPGSYPIGTPRPILDVLALAGGINDFADRRITVARHETGERISLLLSNKADDSLDKNLLIFPGDTVIVPKAGFVYVLGDVGRPGGYSMATNDAKLSVLQTISLAGGAQPTAITSQVRLVRKQKSGAYVEIDLPLGAMEKGKSADIAVQADDIIFVPFSYLRNMAMGVDSLLAAAASAAIYVH